MNPESIVILQYSAVGVLLVIAMLLYFAAADKYNIVDKPNERSSHTVVTIRGGGIIFPLSVVIWSVIFQTEVPIWWLLGTILIAGISFIDDRVTLSTKPRLLVHLVAVSLLIYQLELFHFVWWIVLIAYVLIIGWINAFNFMDGINGITVFYAMAVIAPIAVLNGTLHIFPYSLLVSIFFSLIVFAFYNARRKAKTFAGDVGSISMAFILAYLIISVLIATGEWYYILFVLVYGVDAVLTIVRRLLKKENIFQAHRSHLYQYLVNEKGYSHLSIAGLYGLVQLSISIAVIFSPEEIRQTAAIAIMVAVTVFYLYIKHRIIKSVRF